MEGGSPALIWERWTLPMYSAQLRFWGDHPSVGQILRTVHAKRGARPRYTPPPTPDGDGVVKPTRPIDWSLLDKK